MSGKWPDIKKLKDLVEKQFKATKIEAEAVQKFEACKQCWRPLQDFL